jgi:hypothetical protein
MSGGIKINSKINWFGKIISIQPRIRLLRSFDQRSHSYLGYSIVLKGKIDDQERKFSVGIGKAAQGKYRFKVGDDISGESLLVPDTKKEPVEFYKTSKLKVIKSSNPIGNHPPWNDVPVTLEEYRERGHRRLSAKTYENRCQCCKWGCRMPIEIIIDHWNPRLKRYRFETFCYGPKSCQLYKAGPKRIVPGRKGMTWEEPDWIDEESTGHRNEDE